MGNSDTSLLLVAVILLLGIVSVSPATAAEVSASFSYTPGSPVADETIQLDGSDSSATSGEITEYEWDLDGDGDYGDYYDDTGQNSEVAFDTAGSYTVGLRVTDENGNSDTVRETISVTNEAPSASFEYSPSESVADEKIRLDASASSDTDGEITEYEWDLDGDGDYGDYYDDTGQNSEVAFDTAGSYTVGLRVTDNGDETDVVTKTITVTNEPPSASFEFSPSGPVADEKTRLDASGSSDADGRIVDYEWDLDGDGDYGDYYDDTGQNSEVTFGTAGTYTVGLRITDNGDESDTVRESITVTNEPPSVSFEYSPSEPVADEKIRLDASASSDTDGEITEYEWDLDGDGDYGDYYDDTGQNSEVTFGTAGTYTVGLRITDNGDETDVVTKTITVTNEAPTASFDYSASADGLTIELDGSVSADADGHISEYEWDFDGDGDYGDYYDDTGQTVSVSVDEAGSYTIGLRVTDNGEKSATIRKTVGVSKAPTAEFRVAPRVAAIGEPATFSADASSDPDGTLEAYRWMFPNGETKRGVEVTHQFSTPGVYRVSLTVVDSFGSEATTTKKISVKRPPSADVTWSPQTPRDHLDVVFEVHSDDAIAKYEWDFDGDGAFEKSGRTVTHSFEQTGKRTVRVRAEATTGVATTLTRVVTVQKSAGFELTTHRSRVESGEAAIVTFTVSNEVNDRILDAKLDLDLPAQGVSITGVDGAGLVSSHATRFVEIRPGEEKSLRVYLQFGEDGTYDVTGNVIYYFQTSDNGTPDRRTTRVGPVSIEVGTEADVSTTHGNGSADGESGGQATEMDTPGFGFLLPVVSAVLLLLFGRLRYGRYD